MTSPLSTALADDPLGPSGRWRLVAGARSTTPGHEAPPFRDDLAPRPRLVRRLAGDHLAPLVVPVAPPGYGKTQMLGEGGPRDARPCPRTSLRAEHDDPARLAALIAAARDGLSASQPGVIVLDGADVLRSPQALAVVLAPVDDLEPGSVLAMASRREPG